jgi:thymidylate synthase (FAD)
MSREDLLAKHKEPVPVLDHGFVRLVDVMGSDEDIEAAARISYQKGTRKVSETRGLIRYLVSHRHTSPLEMVELKLHVKLPIFVERQWVRHRMASLNEISARYSELPEEYYVPDMQDVCYQSTDNKQGRAGQVDEDIAKGFQDAVIETGREAFQAYRASLELGIARETARIGLPLGTYTEKIWKIDGHNLLHFLSLRMDPHAQKEIREYAYVVGEIIRDWLPLVWEAFVDYRLEAVTFSRMEMVVLRGMVDKWAADNHGAMHERALPGVLLGAGCTKREVAAFLKKLDLKLHDDPPGTRRGDGSMQSVALVIPNPSTADTDRFGFMRDGLRTRLPGRLVRVGYLDGQDGLRLTVDGIDVGPVWSEVTDADIGGPIYDATDGQMLDAVARIILKRLGESK